MKKYRYFMDIDCEEQWFNKMVDKGYGLKGKGFFFYWFVDEVMLDFFIVKIDYCIFKYLEDFIDYCILFEDSGWKYFFSL